MDANFVLAIFLHKISRSGIHHAITNDLLDFISFSLSLHLSLTPFWSWLLLCCFLLLLFVLFCFVVFRSFLLQLCNYLMNILNIKQEIVFTARVRNKLNETVASKKNAIETAKGMCVYQQ